MPKTSDLWVRGKCTWKEGKAILSYLASSGPDRAIRDPVSKNGRQEERNGGRIQRGRKRSVTRIQVLHYGEDGVFLFHSDQLPPTAEYLGLQVAAIVVLLSFRIFSATKQNKKSTLASHDASPRELPLAKSSLLAQSLSISKPAVAQLEQLTALRVIPEEAKEVKKGCFYFGLFQFCFLFDLHLGPCVPREGVFRAPGQLYSSQPGKLFHLHCELSPHPISTLQTLIFLLPLVLATPYITLVSALSFLDYCYYNFTSFWSAFGI